MNKWMRAEQKLLLVGGGMARDGGRKHFFFIKATADKKNF